MKLFRPTSLLSSLALVACGNPVTVDELWGSGTDGPTDADFVDCDTDAGGLDADGDGRCDHIDPCEGPDNDKDVDGDGVCDSRDVCPDADDLEARKRPDPPDDQFLDENCDGIDGVLATAVFAASGAPPTGTGTRQNPVGSLSRALDLAKSIDGGWVAVGRGAYEGPLVLANGVDVVGGYDPLLDWARSNENLPRVIAANPVLEARFLTQPTQVAWMTFEAERAKSAGASSTAAVVEECRDHLTLTHVRLLATSGRAGKNGADGPPGEQGNNGGFGQEGCNEELLGQGGCTNQPGIGGLATQCANGTVGGVGGPGGKAGVANDDDPLPGAPGGAGTASVTSAIAGQPVETFGGAGTNGEQGGWFDCDEDPAATDGKPAPDPGGKGGDGDDGYAGDRRGDLDGITRLWEPEDAVGGFHGGPGGGGSGGGGGGGYEADLECAARNDIGGSGGGGGAGGCGGTAGTPGGSGGGSLGLLSYKSEVRLQHVTITVGDGGRGGRGGAGGLGGPGGTGGPGGAKHDDSGKGGRGSDGGKGGQGGAAGGGAGGPSVGVLYVGDPPIVEAGTEITIGEPGAGGDSVVDPGEPGFGGQIVDFDTVTEEAPVDDTDAP